MGAFKSQEKIIQKFDEKEAEALDMKVEAASIIRAWYGDPANEWHGKGKDVTSKVKQLIKAGQEVKPDNKFFGDPARKVRKVLLIEMTAWVKKTFRFEKKPLGITFDNYKFPMVITKL